MDKKLKLLWFVLLSTIVLVSCEKEEYLKDNTTSTPFPYQVTKMSKEEIINSSGNRDLFTALNETSSILSQKTTSSTPLFTILDESATVFTDDNNTFTSYTFKTINTVDDGILRNIVVTDISNVFTTYLIQYIKQPNGMLGASYTLLSNDNGGLLKSTISITTCEDIGYWKTVSISDDCVCYMEQWTVEEFCNTVTYDIPDTTIDAGNSGGGGGGGGANTQPGTDSWGTGFPISGGIGGGSSGGFVTQPSYADHKESLMNFSNDPQIKQQIKDWLLLAQSEGPEQGNEWRLGPNNSYSPNSVNLEYSNEFGVFFGNVTSNRVVMRSHVHRSNNDSFFSGGDIVATLKFYKDKDDDEFPVQNENTTSLLVSKSGVYAIRIKDKTEAIDKLQELIQIDVNGKTKANNLHKYFGKNVVDNAITDHSKAYPGLSIDPNSLTYFNFLDSNFTFFFEYYKLNDSLIVFKANLDNDGNVISWSNLTP